MSKDTGIDTSHGQASASQPAAGTAAASAADARAVRTGSFSKIVNTAGTYGIALLFLLIGALLQATGAIGNFLSAHSVKPSLGLQLDKQILQRPHRLSNECVNVNTAILTILRYANFQKPGCHEDIPE